MDVAQNARNRDCEDRSHTRNGAAPTEKLIACRLLGYVADHGVTDRKRGGRHQAHHEPRSDQEPQIFDDDTNETEGAPQHHGPRQQRGALHLVGETPRSRRAQDHGQAVDVDDHLHQQRLVGGGRQSRFHLG